MRIGYVLLACAGMVAGFGARRVRPGLSDPAGDHGGAVPSGGAGDILARMLAPRLEQKWGRPLVVENKPGAGGVIGAVAPQRASPMATP